MRKRKHNGLIHDPKAVEMVDSLDYDQLLRAMSLIRRREIESYRLNRYRVGDPDRTVTP